MRSNHSKTNSAAALVCYVPALHAGYLKLFRRHEGAKIFVLGRSFIDAFPRLNRDLRALDPGEAVCVLEALGFNAVVLEKGDEQSLESFNEIVAPDEDVTRDFASKYLSDKEVSFESVFLRWDGVFANATQDVTPDRMISATELDAEVMRQAYREARKSADWWRQIGAVLVVKDRLSAFGHIRYFPSDLALDIFGTPRITVDFGERPDLYISMHAEADVIAQAARGAIPLEGASLYTTTFPCINCAFLIARSGIKRVYYAEGYSKLDAESILKSAGVEIILVTGAHD